MTRLSPRELDVARLVAAGMTNGQIAMCLYVEEKTVKGHLTAIYRKLGIAGNAPKRVRLVVAMHQSERRVAG